MGRQAEVIPQARINRADLGFPYAKLEIKRNQFKLPVEWNGSVFEPDSVMGFYMRYRNNGANPEEPIGKRVLQPLGKDPVAAYTQFINFEADFERVRRGLAPIAQNQPLNGNTPGSKVAKSLTVAVHEFLEAKKLGKPRSYESYEGTTSLFLEFCKNKYNTLQSIDNDRQAIIRFVAWLKENLQRRSKGSPDNTYRNKLKDLRVFFNFHKITIGLPSKEWPKEKPKRKEKYSMATINAFLDATDEVFSSESDSEWTPEDAKDLIIFLLKTGFRDDEVAHAQYKDVDFKGSKINIDVKPEFIYDGQPWTPKNGGPREESIDLDQKFLQRMKKRKERYNANGNSLIFTNSVGKPNQHLIRIIQEVAKHVGYEKTVELHKFRKTFGTVIADEHGLEKARVWLGHEDIETTARYLAADWDETDEEKQKKITKTWEAIGD